MKSYVFKVELEPDAEGWRAFCPPLEDVGASTWGKTREEALDNIREVLIMVVSEFAEDGRPIPEVEHITVSEGPLVSVNL